MRAPAALLAIPLLAGCCIGLLARDGTSPNLALIAAGGSLIVLLGAMAARGEDDGAMCTVCLVIASLAVGISLGATGARRAYRSSLAEWYALRGARVTSPVVLRGVLREDATLTPAGASLVLDVEAIGPCGRLFDASREQCVERKGGVRLSVGGTMAIHAFDTWRAGRTLSVTATLREPVTYRDPRRARRSRLHRQRACGRVSRLGAPRCVGDGGAMELALGRHCRSNRDRRSYRTVAGR
jgi:hypothetical protein